MIELESIRKRFGEVDAVRSVSLTVAEGELVSLLGPSGCGKTTTLRIIAGFETPTSGRLRIAGRDMTNVPVERRGLSMVFQNYALFPHLTVFENVAFGLRLRKLPRAEIIEKVKQALAQVGLAELGDRLPRRLSGGQQQRVSLARALVVNPSVLLLDEPLSNLDLKLREQLRDEIRRLQRSLGITAVYVTHDQGEAMAMSDRVAVMRAGRIEQIGTPRSIYEQPATAFVASFIGQCNLLGGRPTADGTGFQTASGSLFRLAERCPAAAVQLAIRPEMLHFGQPPDGANGMAGTVREVVYLGESALVTVALSGGQEVLTATWRIARGTEMPREGDSVALWVAAADCVPVAEETVAERAA